MPVKTHGLTKNPLYLVWYSMIRRCNNPEDIAYKFYGERGISVCKEWRDSVTEFVDYVSSLPNCKEKGFTLDRIDSTKDYMPGNVRWPTHKEQQRNKSSNRIVTYQGMSMCLSAWAEKIGIPYPTLRLRLNRGWSIEDAFSSPKGNYHVGSA